MSRNYVEKTPVKPTEIKTLTTSDGTKMSYFNGKLHSYDGPAIKFPEGSGKKDQYFVYGIEHTQKQWKKVLSERNGIPFAKSSVGKAAGARM